MVSSSKSTPASAEEFSLITGGPVYQFLLRIGLVKPPLDRVSWRILIISALVWVPLLVLTLLDGRCLSGVKIPFLYDFEVQIRLLVSLPLLIAAEVIIHTRMKAIVAQFKGRQIVTPAIQTQFDSLIQSALRLRNSMAIELGLIVFVLFTGAWIWRTVSGLHSDTWYAFATSGGSVKTPAGYWYQFVSVPIVQFIGLRWYFRIFIWARLLLQISRLDLNLVPTHPDRSCGLGFLDGIVLAMAPFLLAHSCLLSGYLANRILYEGAKLPDYYLEIGILAVFLSLLALGPLCVFTPRLLRARREGLYTYGQLASNYVIGFDRKWIGGERSPQEPLVGSSDIQSLADLANSFAIVRSITPFPFGRGSLIGLVIVIALPLLPLGLTMFSLEELAVRLLKILI
jgi:hypothetical protein